MRRLAQFAAGAFVVAILAALIGLCAPHIQVAEAQEARNPAWLPGRVVTELPQEAARDAERLSAALRALKPQQDGVVDAFILSIGGWDDPVFQREAAGAAQVLAQRYSATGRVVVLTNGAGAGAPRTYPSARPQNISAALGAIAQRMNKNEDVLVLFLTSHGDQSGAISLVERNRQAFSLTPPELRRALDDAGATRRLILLSACYSGAFLPALQAPETIVITAAAYNRPSFGCEPQNDWTYFGDAFINRALRQNLPLLDAFRAAQEEIAAWERRDKLRPSYPSIVVGERAQPVIDAMRGRVE